jgi:hypothetical protein
MAGSAAEVDLDSIIEENTRARAETLEAVEALTEDRRREVWFGDWSALDIVAHLAGAQEGYAEALEHVARGEPPRITGWEPGPPDDWNRATVEARRGRDWERLIADLGVACERHEAAVRAVPIERYEATQDGFPNEFSPWPNSAMHYAANAQRHERGHVAAILRWRRERGI